MTLPSVIITELDGALGVLPPSAGRLLAVIGTASAGPLNAPATYARVRDLTAAFGVGPAVEAAAYYINTYGKPVLFIRSAAGGGDSGSVSSVTSTGAGTSVVSVQASPTPVDDFEFVMRIVAGGTIGTAGITYQLSYDGGRSYGLVTALGTANTLVIPNAGGVQLNFAAGTMVAGATHSARATAPNFDSTTVATALDALAASSVQWELCLFAGPIASTGVFDQIESKFAGLFATGKYRAWVGNTRMPNAGESESAYRTAMDTLWSSKASQFGSFYSGANKLSSALSGRQYRRPVAFPVGSREQAVSEEVNVADPNLGPLPGVSIRDANGNADEHDEAISPGLDDLRLGTLRTWDGIAGVYVTRPRLFSAQGSDFRLMPHRRVLNLAHAALRIYMLRRLNKPIRVNAGTGYVLESEALEIEAGALAAMRGALLAKPKASAVQFTLSRVDNVLSTLTLTGTARVVPLAYPETITLDVGFYNPALVVRTAA